MYVLAYDFGTGGNKASLYGADGACVASGFDAYPTTYPRRVFTRRRRRTGGAR